MKNKSSRKARTGRTPDDYRSFGLLREIRAAAQDLQETFKETMEVASKLDAAGKKALIAQRLGRKMLARINFPISRNLERLEGLFAGNYKQYDWGSDNIEIIRLNWEHVMDFWPDPALTYDEQSQAVEQAKVHLDRIIYECASLTLSPRINDILENLRVGQPLDWDFKFSSELPNDKKMSELLLNEMAQEGGVLNGGVVDVDRRVIYKVAESRAMQVLSVVGLAVFVVACGIIVPYVLCWMGTQTDQWPLGLGDLRRLYATYAFLFLGAGAHVAIDAVKAGRAQTRPNFRAINDWILWLHVRSTSIFWSLAWILLGFIVLSLTTPRMAWQSAFFLGYSFDSVLGIFLTRFETAVTAKTQGLIGDKSRP